MKKLAFSGMVILIVLFLGTCGVGGPTGTDNGVVEYTDVVYSYAADGSPQVTLYLDGTKVPVTRSQRALTTDLAKMSHDFYEAVFWYQGTPTRIARASWEIGQAAGIRGVHRTEWDGTTGGIDYSSSQGGIPSAAGDASAVIFVGRTSDKTLMGIGHLTSTTGPDYAGPLGYKITDKTVSVTFTVSAIETRLNIATGLDTPVLPGSLNYGNVTSFVTASGYKTPGVGQDPYGVPSVSVTKAYNDTTAGELAKNQTLDEISFPYYTLPVTQSSVKAKYTFYYRLNAVDNPMALDYAGIRIRDEGPTGSPQPEVIKRWPRYLVGGQYRYIENKIDFGTIVTFDKSLPTASTLANTSAFNGVVGFNFDTTAGNASGLFSFTFAIPVYAMTTAASTNGGPSYVTWSLKPGFSTNLYALDNGIEAGGCILMGVNVGALDWIEIKTTGMPWQYN